MYYMWPWWFWKTNFIKSLGWSKISIDYYVPMDFGERYIIGLQAHLPNLECLIPLKILTFITYFDHLEYWRNCSPIILTRLESLSQKKNYKRENQICFFSIFSIFLMKKWGVDIEVFKHLKYVNYYLA